MCRHYLFCLTPDKKWFTLTGNLEKLAQPYIPLAGASHVRRVFLTQLSKFDWISASWRGTTSFFLSPPLLFRAIKPRSFCLREPHTCCVVCVCVWVNPPLCEEWSRTVPQLFIIQTVSVFSHFHLIGRWGGVRLGVQLCVWLRCSLQRCSGYFGHRKRRKHTHTRWKFPCGVHAKCLLKTSDIKMGNVLPDGCRRG